MKPIYIEFIPTRRRMAVWVAALLVAAVVLGGVLARSRAFNASIDAAAAQSVALAAQQLTLQTDAKRAASTAAADPQLAQLRSVSRTLQRDWNLAFASIENLNEPGTRLLGFSIDAATETIRVEYEVDSVSRAAAMTAMMNAGYPTPPWRLEAVTSTPSRSGVSSGEALRASWSSRLGMLR